MLLVLYLLFGTIIGVTTMWDKIWSPQFRIYDLIVYYLIVLLWPVYFLLIMYVVLTDDDI